MDAVPVDIARIKQEVRDSVHSLHKPGHHDWKACALSVAKNLMEELSEGQLCKILKIDSNPERLAPIRSCLSSMAATIIIEEMIKEAEAKQATA